MIRRAPALALLLAFLAAPAAAVEPDEILADPALEARARAISKELRCLVCQNQSIDDSDAPLARDLRIVVRERLTAGASDEEVVRFVTARYGDFVLLSPPFKARDLGALARPGGDRAGRGRRRGGVPAPPPPRRRGGGGGRARRRGKGPSRPAARRRSMILFAVLALMAAVAALCVLVPLLRRHAPPRPRAEHDVEIYRDQLAEIERDRDRGLVTDAQLEASRAEIGRRLLAADSARADAGATGSAPRAVLAVALAIVLPLAAGGLYVWQGAAVPPASDTPQAHADADMETLVARLAERMKDRPDDPRGWRLLARSLASLGRHEEAARAYGRAASLLPADAGLRALRGEALAAAAAGTVTEEAERDFAAAVSIDPGEPRARFYLGLAALQRGDREAALARWRALEADSPEDAEWLPMLRRRIAGLAPGPTGEDIEAARRMSPSARAAMIRSMVEGLALRLEEEPDDPEGWARLARSWRVLGEAEKERAALRAAGDAALRAGDRDAARRHWSQLRGLLPEGSPERAGIDRRIEALGAAD